MSSQHQPQEDPFTTLLTLEDTLYTTAYTSGTVAGAKAGKIEGRIFGLEKGFEKFAALGHLHGRSVVWGARLQASLRPSREVVVEKEEEEEEAKKYQEKQCILPVLPALPRLPPHITLLHSLTDPPTFSTSNTEDAVADLDDRFKRGTSKAKIISLLLKEPDSAAALATFASPNGSPRHGGKGRREGAGGGAGGAGGKNDNMEDFGGSRLPPVLGAPSFQDYEKKNGSSPPQPVVRRDYRPIWPRMTHRMTWVERWRSGLMVWL
ncbi:hypothetical protein K504DRAFT_494651 [Pleomassaria siparia CBS 279.74]|uniref:Essential protein Yae1 N-terminal domain-containing protein n=1 Tax=Pleomassaria siparia CBS 279.74 TaxID=1314801 RepID=A0A6G1JXG4_9PLEO|nr:hypothetical protein K504DRAFT_494651 [Pleomassaria siparia CBS 279.74]